MSKSDFIRWVEGQLRTGYHLAPHSNGGYTVIDPDGQMVYLPNGPLLRIMDSTTGGTHHRQRALQHLRAAHAAAPRRKTEKTRTAPRPIIRDPKTAFVLSTEILRDTRATPRERRIAKEYQDSLKQIEELRLLAQRLGQRLRSLGD